MYMVFSIGPALGRAVHSVYRACLSERLSNCVCVLLSLFGIEDRMWVVIVLNPDHCLSIFCFLSHDMHNFIQI